MCNWLKYWTDVMCSVFSHIEPGWNDKFAIFHCHEYHYFFSLNLIHVRISFFFVHSFVCRLNFFVFLRNLFIFIESKYCRSLSEYSRLIYKCNANADINGGKCEWNSEWVLYMRFWNIIINYLTVKTVPNRPPEWNRG